MQKDETPNDFKILSFESKIALNLCNTVGCYSNKFSFKLMHDKIHNANI